jgi:hypothetical protein
MKATMLLALIELAEGPVQEVARLAGADAEVAGAHIQEKQGVMTAEGDASPELAIGLDDRETERLVDGVQERNRCGDSGEAAANHTEFERPMARTHWRRGMSCAHDVHIRLQDSGCRLKRHSPCKPPQLARQHMVFARDRRRLAD